MFAQKKGLSSIIATIAIILLSVAAVGFIAGYIVPFVKNNLYESTECVGYEDYFTFEEEFGYNCYTNISEYWLYGMSVRAGSAGEETPEKVKGFKFLFLKEGTSEPASVIDGENAAADAGKVRMLNYSLPKLDVPYEGEVRTYIYNSSEKYSSVELYPILKTGKLCDKSDSIRIENIICTKPLIIT